MKDDREAGAVLDAVRRLADAWEDLLRTESEIMTTPQRNAHRNDLAELRAVLEGSYLPQ